MKKILITLAVVLLFNVKALFSQDISCSELYEYVVENYSYKDATSCFNSSLLVKVEFYKLDNVGFVVAYIKKNEYDFRGKPYIFCGISDYNWRNFKVEGMCGSWGKAFHKYIRDNTCNCY